MSDWQDGYDMCEQDTKARMESMELEWVLMALVIAVAKRGLGAPGDYGYETREGKALHLLYDALGAIKRGKPLRDVLEQHYTPEAVTEGVEKMNAEIAELSRAH